MQIVSMRYEQFGFNKGELHINQMICLAREVSSVIMKGSLIIYKGQLAESSRLNNPKNEI